MRGLKREIEEVKGGMYTFFERFLLFKFPLRGGRIEGSVFVLRHLLRFRRIIVLWKWSKEVLGGEKSCEVSTE